MNRSEKTKQSPLRSSTLNQNPPSLGLQLLPHPFNSRIGSYLLDQISPNCLVTRMVVYVDPEALTEPESKKFPTTLESGGDELGERRGWGYLSPGPYVL